MKCSLFNFLNISILKVKSTQIISRHCISVQFKKIAVKSDGIHKRRRELNAKTCFRDSSGRTFNDLFSDTVM